MKSKHVDSNGGIHVFAVEFTVNCMSVVDMGGTSLSISCVAENGVIVSLTCSYDNGSRTEDCGKKLRRNLKTVAMVHFA